MMRRIGTPLLASAASATGAAKKPGTGRAPARGGDRSSRPIPKGTGASGSTAAAATGSAGTRTARQTPAHASKPAPAAAAAPLPKKAKVEEPTAPKTLTQFTESAGKLKALLPPAQIKNITDSYTIFEDNSDPLHLSRQVAHIAAINGELKELLPVAAPILFPSTKKEEKPTAKGHKARLENLKAKKNNEPKSVLFEEGFSLTKLAVATAFDKGTIGQKSNGRACPITKGTAALRTLTTDTTFLQNPCPIALRQRLHYLACEQFSHIFSWQSFSPVAQPVDAAKMPSKLSNEIERSFGSFEKFAETLSIFASNRHQSGFTWVVWNPKSTVTAAANEVAKAVKLAEGDAAAKPITGRLEILNTPRNTIPQMYGMYPVLAVNVTDRAVFSVPSDRSNRFDSDASVAAAAGIPSWSRAARNPALTAAAEKQAKADRDASLHVMRPVGEQKADYVQFVLGRLSFDFAAEQLEKGMSYYTSEKRATAVSSRNKALDVAAVQQAINAYKKVDHVIEEPVAPAMNEAATTPVADLSQAETAADVAVDATAAAASSSGADMIDEIDTPAAVDAASRALADAAGDDDIPTTASASEEVKETPKSAPPSPATPAAPTSVPPPEKDVVETITEEDLVYRVYADGRRSWSYNNGRVVTMHEDGTSVTKESTPEGDIMTTTVKGDYTCWEYEKGGYKVETFEDGRTVTTYKDGTVA